jgi:hypothetical protein
VPSHSIKNFVYLSIEKQKKVKVSRRFPPSPLPRINQHEPVGQFTILEFSRRNAPEPSFERILKDNDSCEGTESNVKTAD